MNDETMLEKYISIYLPELDIKLLTNKDKENIMNSIHYNFFKLDIAVVKLQEEINQALRR